MHALRLRILTLPTPIGPITLGETDMGIYRIDFDQGETFQSEEASGYFCIEDKPMRFPAQQQLTEYFKGIRKKFDLPLDVKGTSFQQKVWKALMDIPYGETRAYQDISVQIGSPRSARAIGQANRANPVPIIVPCHRVIAANGTMGGYAWGLNAKQFLLSLEKEYR